MLESSCTIGPSDELAVSLTGLVFDIVGPALREENQLYILPYKYIFCPSVMLLLGSHKSNLGIFHTILISAVILYRKTCGFPSCIIKDKRPDFTLC